MEQVILKKEFDEFMNLKGEVRGMALKSYGDYILKTQGEEGLKKLEGMIIKLGYPIEYREIRALDFYPLGLEGLTLLGIRRLFNFDDKEIQKMGGFQSKFSILIRIFMKYLVSIERTLKIVPRMWRSYYTVGDLKTVKYDEKKRSVILRLENFKLSPLHCQDLIGYFPGILQIIVGGKPTCEEIKCSFLGDEYHEFLMKW